MVHNLQKLNSNSITMKNDEYYTPLDILDYFRGLGANFVYDPASNDKTAIYLGIPNYDDIESDGLREGNDWNNFDGDIWINPPFTLKKQFFMKAVKTFNAGFKHSIYILVPDKSITNKYMGDFIDALPEEIGVTLYIPNGRISFIDKNYQPTKSSFFGSVIYKISYSKTPYSNLVYFKRTINS